MLISRLRVLLFSATEAPKLAKQFWSILSLLIAAIFALIAMKEAFSSTYVVQDDARQHVFWMQRFVDNQLLPHDLIADYFQSVAPLGYYYFYKLMALAHIDPYFINKLLPLMLALITTIYGFEICWQILSVPIAAFIATILLNQSLWLKDDLVSATPRAFLYPILLAFLYYLINRSLWPCLLMIILQALFYPPFVPVMIGTICFSLIKLPGWKIYLSRDHNDYILLIAAVITAIIVMLPFVLGSNKFGPVITVAEAKQLPEFLSAGRTRFFLNDAWQYWFTAERSGLLPMEWIYLPIKPFHMFIGILLPVLFRYPNKFPLIQNIKSTQPLPQLLITSLIMFFAAHALLFKLYLPSRFTQHTFKIIIAIATGITITILLDALFHWAETETKLRSILNIFVPAITALSLIIILFYPLLLNLKVAGIFPYTHYSIGREAKLYQFFAQQPKDILIASLSEEANNLPTFAHRSILVGREYAIPYHTGYYHQFRERAIDLVHAQYSADINDLKTFINKYHVDYIMLDRDAFNINYANYNAWIKMYQPATDEAFKNLQTGIKPALNNLIKESTVFETQNIIVLDTKTILARSQ